MWKLGLLLGFIMFCLCLSSIESLDMEHHIPFPVDNDQSDRLSVCHHSILTNYLVNLEERHPDLVELRSLGKSSRGREIWNLVLTNKSVNSEHKQQIKLVGNINGYSGPACVILVRFVEFLLAETRALRGMEILLMAGEIHIVPNLNPDGYAKSKPNDCTSRQGMRNANRKILNRNFPNPFSDLDIGEDDDERQLEPETEAVTKWIQENNFVISAALTTGTRHTIYPYDMAPNSYEQGQPHFVPSVDNGTFGFLCGLFNTADWVCPGADLSRLGTKQCMNGAELHHAEGTMADYNYQQGVLEVTIGLDCCNNFNSTEHLEFVFEKHVKGLEDLIVQGVFSLRKQVVDAETGKPLENATITMHLASEENPSERSVVHFKTKKNGYFVRAVADGVYKIKVAMPRYEAAELLYIFPNDTELPNPPIRLKKIPKKSQPPSFRIFAPQTFLQEAPTIPPNNSGDKFRQNEAITIILAALAVCFTKGLTWTKLL